MSPFRRRCAERDINRELPKLLLEKEFDILLVDFIDERFNLWRTGNGIVTISSELLESGAKPAKAEIIEAHSKEKLELWKDAWEQFTAFLREHGLFHKLVVNRVFWAAKRNDGQQFEKFPEELISRHNAMLEAMYAEAGKTGDRFLAYGNELFSADANHKWGGIPFPLRQGTVSLYCGQAEKGTFYSFL